MERARNPTPVLHVQPVPQRAPSVSLVKPPRTTMPTNEELDRWILAVATAADRQAFAALFKHFAPRLKGFLLRAGCAADLAEELAQETMVTVWRKAASFDPARAQLSTWIYTIARNLRIDHHRRNVRQVDLGDGEDDWDFDPMDPDPAASPDEQVLALQRSRRVRDALAQLTPEQASLLRLSFFEEHPHSQIARELGMPLGTVKSRIRLAVAQLRRLLDSLAP